MRVIDTFAGPGGWDTGLRSLGRDDVLGIEWDRAACDTALAAGHARLWADVAALDPQTVADAYCDGTVEGFIASPPCQAWSMAGKRQGELDRAACHELADRMAAGDDSTDWREWEDERSPLVCQPVRWVRDLRPEWVALEEVPAVASLWEHFARIFRAWGYNVWTGDLNSADYGVPQTRVRRILIASRVAKVSPPEPTHSRDEHDADLFGAGRLPWVSMAQALGWGMTARPYFTVAAGTESGGADSAMVGGSGARKSLNEARESAEWVMYAAGVTGEGRPKDAATQPADTLTGKGTAYWAMRSGQTVAGGPHAIRSLDEPSGTIISRADLNQWVNTRPATTVMGDPRIAQPGHSGSPGKERSMTGAIRVTVQEAGVLQSFPADYPWQGSRTKQFQQVGNAIPPLLAAHVLAAVLGVAVEAAA